MGWGLGKSDGGLAGAPKNSDRIDRFGSLDQGSAFKYTTFPWVTKRPSSVMASTATT